MSIASPCPGCSLGDHSRHRQDHGIRPGLIGGTYCDCAGDCKLPKLPAHLGGNESGDDR